MHAWVAAAVLGSTSCPGAQDVPLPIPIEPLPSRFQLAAPLPGLPAVMLDAYHDGIGLAQQTARNRRLQARIMWIDGTANLERLGSELQVRAWVRRLQEIGFNTLVFDVKPIVGYTLYPSKLTEKLVEWRGQRLPIEFDPLRIMADECRRVGMPLFASINAFSEGHRLTGTGPGYQTPELQTVQYVPQPVAQLGSSPSRRVPLVDTVNPTQLGPGEGGVFTDVRRLVDFRRHWKVSLAADGTVIGWSREAPPQSPPNGSVLVLPPDFSGGPVARVAIQSEAKFLPISQHHTQFPLMMNPNRPEVRERVKAFVREILEHYDVAGIIFDDRFRHANWLADFSEDTRRAFETYLGKRSAGGLVWPDDVFSVTYTVRLVAGVRPGKWYDAWFAWRARTMRDFAREIHHLVSTIRPSAQFGIYAGSALGAYEKFGVNWSSPDVSIGFPAFTRSYSKTGMAPYLDFLITGCYYREATIFDAMTRALATGRTVEAAAQVANRAVRDQTWTYAGIMLADFWETPRQLADALQAACGASQGVMVFDLSHRFEQFEATLRQAFATPARAPHMALGLLQEVRRLRERLDRMGVKDPPIPLYDFDTAAGM